MSTLRKLKKPLGCKPTQQQKTHLIEYLEKNVYLIDGVMCRQKTGPWNKLAKKLNALGGAQKSGEKWLKYWYDQRSYIRDRHAELISNKVRIKPSFFDPYSKPRKLNDYEKRVIRLTSTSTTAKIDNFLEGITPKNESESIIPNEGLEETPLLQLRQQTDVPSDWIRDSSRYSPRYITTRNRTQPSNDVLPSQMFTEVNIKSECNSNPSTSAIPSPESDYTKILAPPNDQIFVPPPMLFTEENIKLESNSEVRNIASISIERPRTKPKKLFRISKPVEGYCGNCKSRTNMFDRKIRLKNLAIMKSTEKFNREMEMKKLLVEEKKIEALNKLINVVQNGFDRITDMVQK